MTILLVLAAILLMTAVVLAVFLNASPASLSLSLRLIGPVLIGLPGLVLLLFGRSALGGVLISIAVAWYGRSMKKNKARPTAQQRSNVRTGLVEMELDHDSGEIDGVILDGEYIGQKLSDLSLETLLHLRESWLADEQTVSLLETYLESRFPVWRDHLNSDEGARHGGTAGSGRMTKQEAYELLGLGDGATAAEIRQAHRSLMQRLHPDKGGTAFLAARVNEARDILLSKHG